MNIKFIVEYVLIYITKNIFQNYNVVPCFVEKNPKQHFKSMLYQNKIYGFSTASTNRSSSSFLKTFYFIIFFLLLFSKTLTFLTIPNHIIMIKTRRIQNSN
jgi:hypothetical protein